MATASRRRWAGHDLWSSTTYVLYTATPLTMVLSSTRSVPTTSSVTTRYWHGLVMKSVPDFITLAKSDGTTTQTFAYDGLGSVRQLVEESGSVGAARQPRATTGDVIRAVAGMTGE